MKNKCIAIVLAAALLATVFPALPARAQGETIEIETAEDLIRLAENCHEDDWSRGKTVELKNDITVLGSGFESIPIFNGTFLGNGHEISGYNYGGGGYVTGFFRYVGEEGTISDLTLRANITASGEQKITGTIAGINQGIIRGCEFIGTVSGESETGGIVGINQPGGLIFRCTNSGSVTGYYYTGGIAGKNCSTILYCTNGGYVNDSAQWVARDDEMKTDLLSALSDMEDRAGLKSGTDTGGIAGYSIGTVVGCINEGVVGYEHAGLNVGGICGRSSGVIRKCSNTGKVYGKRDVGGIAGQAEPYIEINQAQSVRNELEVLNEQIEKAMADAEHAGAVIQSDLSRLQNATQGALDKAADLSENMADSAGLPKTELTEEKLKELAKNGIDAETLKKDGFDLSKIEQQAEDGTLTKESAKDALNIDRDPSGDLKELSKEMTSLSKSVERLNEHADSYATEMRGDISAINAQAQSTHDLMTDIVNGVQEEGVSYLFRDVSGTESSYAETGIIQSCTNRGWVNADSNGGGIVGNMAIDEDNARNNVIVLMSLKAGETYCLSSVVEDCTNEGFVLGRTDRIGGIAGDMAHGIVSGSYGYGDVESEGGSYLGGIAGYSEGTIRDSYVLSMLSGNQFLGGVAGYGKKVQGCISMPVIVKYNGTCGAIAGQVLRTENTEEMDTLEIRDNFYVSDDFYGIDDISYQGSAEALSYAELCEREDLPAAFRKLKVTFVADDEVLGTQEVHYGEKLENLHLPDVPDRSGCNAVWEDLTDRSVIGNMVVRAEYHTEIPTVESFERDVESGKALGFVSGHFEEDTTLSVRPSDAKFLTPEEYKYEEATILETDLRGADTAENETYILRLFLPHKCDSIWRQNGDTWEKVSFERRSSYAEMWCDGGTAVFAIVREPDYTVLFIVLGVCAAAFAIMLLILLKLRLNKTANST